MKKLTLIIAIVFSGMLMQAQYENNYNKENYEYQHYSDIYQKANAQRITGMILTLSGIGGSVAGLVINNNDGNSNLGGLLFLGSSLAINVGIPLWISGAAKRHNNRKEMDRIQRNKHDFNKSISLGTTPNGVGLKFNF